MTSENTVQVRWARLFGAFMTVVGGLFWFLASSMLDSAGVTLKLFVAGPAITLLGAALAVFPGGAFSRDEIRSGRISLRALWERASIPARVSWIAALAVGIMLSVQLGHGG